MLDTAPWRHCNGMNVKTEARLAKADDDLVVEKGDIFLPSKLEIVYFHLDENPEI